MSMIEQNTKFSFANPRKTKQFKEQEFFAWTSNNFYRTSYNDMREKVSCVDPMCTLARLLPPKLSDLRE